PSTQTHTSSSPSFLTLTLPPSRSTLFPYTTLFRSSSITRNCTSPWACMNSTSPRSTNISYPLRKADRIPQKSPPRQPGNRICRRSEEHTSELQSRFDLVCRLLLEKHNIETVNHDKA